MIRAQVFRWIQRHEPVSRREVMAHFRITGAAATNYFLRLRADGAITKTGSSRRALWTVANPNADVSDGRGLHIKSLDNLRPSWRRKTKFHNRGVKDWPKAPDICKCWPPG